MKKTVLTAIAAWLFAFSIKAQISVWDGNSTIWTHGNGTPESPYLIESAQNLAYLAEMANNIDRHGENRYHIIYADTCFLLTTDIDLGADAGLEWSPIAENGNDLHAKRFGGHFDGGNHIISNMVFKNRNYTYYMGLFGFVEGGSIKNIIIDSGQMIIPEFYISGMAGNLGILIGCGINVSVENCTNKTDVVWQYTMCERAATIGGFFGSMSDSQISHCINRGNITVPNSNTGYYGTRCGGIGGTMDKCEVYDCFNYGDIYVHNGEICWEQIGLCGGLAGTMSGSITNSANMGNINMVIDGFQENYYKVAGGLVGASRPQMLSIVNSYSISDMTINDNEIPSWTGGIIGAAFDSVSVENCYYVGNQYADNIGGIIGRFTEQTAVANSYYVNTVASVNSYGVPKTESEMKTQDFVSLINAVGDVYAFDALGFNNGYPIFSQYYSMDEMAADGISAFPNPAKDYVTIKAENIAEISVQDMLGNVVLKHNCSGDNATVDTSSLPNGVYFCRAKSTNGKTETMKIVVRH